ncbi:hypothetical protein BGZ50_000184 [Haplosporangium sp. Z 11]|nr:hypothetical protein BGZ50_000184 [Haplosporangium sp. Z 11]
MSETALHFDSTDPILCSIADELRCTLDYNSGRHYNSDSSINGGHGLGGSGTEGDDASMAQEYAFRLESFLTRPRTCSKLFPPRVQKKRYQRIVIQERLVLVSIGKPSSTATTTITTAVNDAVTVTEAATKTAAAAATTTTTKEDVSTDDRGDTKDVLVAGLEVLEYTLFPIDHDDSHNNNSNNSNNNNNNNGNDANAEYIKSSSTRSRHQRPERIMYIAKVDTSGCWPLRGLDMRSIKCSPAQALVRGYLKAIRGRTWSQIQRPGHHGQVQEAHKTSLFVFARAQPQYLFAESAKNSGKRALNDRGLVRWWKNVVASVYGVSSTCSSHGQQSLDEDKHNDQDPIQDSEKPKTKVQGWWLIPGIETERQALNIIQSSSSSSPASSTASSTFVWNYGYPDKGSKEMAHTLIPQFPDDPKSRMMQSPSCQGGFVDIRTFWELAAIGEESGAGKITGFFRIVEEDIQEGQQQQQHEQQAVSSPTETLLSEPSAASTSGSTGDYTKMINFLLELDFSTLDHAYTSTKQWQDRVAIWVKKAAEKEALAATAASITDLEISQAYASDTNSSKASGTDSGTDSGSGAGSSSKPLWIQQTIVPVHLICRHSQDPQEEKNQEQKQVQQARDTAPVLNILGAGLIKRKASESPSAPAATINVLNTSLIKRKVAPKNISVTASSSGPAVNVLSASLIKRKPTATTAATTAEKSSTTTTTAAAGVPSIQSPPSSSPAVNILGANFIKKRKVNP